MIDDVLKANSFKSGSPKEGVFNCPNCGSQITGDICKYCNTVFYDFACLDMDKTAFIKIKHGNRILLCNVIPLSSQITHETNPSTLYFDNRPCITLQSTPDITIDLSLRVIPNKDGTQYIVIDEDRLKGEK